jgi:hypothetical protein
MGPAGRYYHRRKRLFDAEFLALERFALTEEKETRAIFDPRRRDWKRRPGGWFRTRCTDVQNIDDESGRLLP